MLEGLDRVDWKTLRHAYGAAADVPELIRALLSEDPAERKAAIHELFGNIYHQGTVYEASSYAVPFLMELLASPSTPDHESVACLLASIASGTGYFEVHASDENSREKWQQILGKEGRSLERELEMERVVKEAVRLEAVKALPMLVPFLSSLEPEVRMSIASAFGAYRSNASGICRSWSWPLRMKPTKRLKKRSPKRSNGFNRSDRTTGHAV